MHGWCIQMNEWYLEELCDALRQVLVALDVELQLVESGRQRGGTTALVTPAQRNTHRAYRRQPGLDFQMITIHIP